MTTQTELFAPRIKTSKGSMACSSLRPGAWLSCDGYAYLVLINSAKAKRAVVRFYSGPLYTEYSDSYRKMEYHDYRYIGSGKPRRWISIFPAFIRKHIQAYSKP